MGKCGGCNQPVTDDESVCECEPKEPAQTFDEWIADLRTHSAKAHHKRQGFVNDFFETQEYEIIRQLVVGYIDDELMVKGKDDSIAAISMTVGKMTIAQVKEKLDYFGITSTDGIQEDDFLAFMNKAYRKEFNLAF